MKKILMSVVLIVFLLLMAGCSNNNEGTVVDVNSNVDVNDILPNDDNDVVLNDGDLIVVKSEGKFVGDLFECSFVVKNNSNYELKSISVNFSLCDNEGNVLGADSAYLYATIFPGKQGTVKGSLSEENVKDASYIIIDSYYYDGNGNNTVFELYADRDNAEQTKVIIPSKSNVTETSKVIAGVITQPYNGIIKERSIVFNYDEFVATPSKYEGKYVCLKGQILAKELTGTIMMVFRIDVTPESFSSDDEIVHVTYIDDYIDSSVYKIGSSVTIYGEFIGVGMYDTAYAKDVKMPEISADIVEKS